MNKLVIKLNNIVLTSLIIFNVHVLSQESAILGSLEQALNDDSVGNIFGSPQNRDPDEDQYLSLTQSKTSNVVRQFNKIESIPSRDEYKEELRKKRIELAVQLCSSDPRACYLLENYAEYKEDKRPTSFDELQLFGVDIFAGYPLSFNQVDSTALPMDYKIKTGDKLSVQFFGVDSGKYSLVVNSNGSIVIPNIGELFVINKTLAEVEAYINSYLEDVLVGSTAIPKLESVFAQQVYTLGDVMFPGLYNLSSTSKVINGVIASGGFTKTSSLRSIKLIRNNETFAEYDLYDFLIYGNINDNTSLENADSILVSSIKNSASILGAVNRPGIYEIKEGENLSDLIEFSLGFQNRANQNLISISRIQPDGRYKTINLDGDVSNFLLKSGDRIFIPEIKGFIDNAVRMYGAIRNSGEYAHKGKMMLSDVFNPSADLIDSSYTGLIVIKRKDIASNSSKYIFTEYNSNDFEIMPGDELYFLAKEDVDFINSKTIYDHVQKDKFLELQDNLNMSEASFNSAEYYNEIACLQDILSFGGQSFADSIAAKLSLVKNKKDRKCTDFLNRFPFLTPIILNLSIPVIGEVSKPGLYPSSSSLSGKILIDLAGGIIPSADDDYLFESSEHNSSEIFTFSDLEINNKTNIKFINVVKNKYENTIGYVEIFGEFKFPGRYPISEFTTLLDIYKRAGGLTIDAFPDGGILTRDSIRLREQKALENAKIELTEILSTAITSGVIEQSSSEALGLVNILSEMQSAQAIGRIVTEFDEQKIKNDRGLNIILKPGDSIYMPSISNTVTVVGNVLNPVTVPFAYNRSINYYINLAGGLRDSADDSKIYVLLPNGKAQKLSNMFISLKRDVIMPGSSIIVPREARPLSGLALVEAITPVLANLSITAASLNSISNN